MLGRGGYSGAVARGVHRYARPQRPWVLLHTDGDAAWLELVLGWEPDGLVVFASHPGPVLDRVVGSGVPAVNVATPLDPLPLPRIGTRDDLVGRLAAEHLLDRGYRHYAAVSYPHHGASVARLTAYRDRLAEAGFTPAEAPHPSFRDQASHPAAVTEAVETAVAWLGELPTPVAVFCTVDAIAYWTSEACRVAGLRVPEDVALLGVDNDELYCEMAFPPLSSIQAAAEQVGVEAAALLDRMIAGEPPPDAPVLLPPVGVVTRQSTDIVAIDDPDVAAVLRFIREHTGEAVGVEDALAETRVSRRLIEQRFKAALGRTPLQEIHRVRIERAKHLLASTDRTVAEVAADCGFGSMKRLEVNFRRLVGEPPSAYRKRFERR